MNHMKHQKLSFTEHKVHLSFQENYHTVLVLPFHISSEPEEVGKTAVLAE